MTKHEAAQPVTAANAGESLDSSRMPLARRGCVLRSVLGLCMRRIGAIVVGSLMVLAACEPTFAQSSRVRDEGTNSATTNFDDPFHGRYASYGVETTNSIRVLVAGNCLKSPGYYFVSKGSTFGDAIKLAGVEKGAENCAGLVISIGRKGQTKGRYRMLHFDALKEAEQEVLRDGDELEMRVGRIIEKRIH